MSHIAVFKKLKFTELRLLQAAFAALGWKVVENATIRTMSAQERKRVFPWVAVNPDVGSNHYDVGIERNITGDWTLLGDFGYGGIHSKLSIHDKLEKVQMHYNEAFAAMLASENNGELLERQTLADGTLTGILEMEVEI